MSVIEGPLFTNENQMFTVQFPYYISVGSPLRMVLDCLDWLAFPHVLAGSPQETWNGHSDIIVKHDNWIWLTHWQSHYIQKTHEIVHLVSIIMGCNM